MLIDEERVVALFGSDAHRALYRALWLHLKEAGLDDPELMADPDEFVSFYDYGGYPSTLIRLDPVANPDCVPYLRRLYHLPDDADWDTLQTVVRDDGEHTTLWDPVTDQVFFVSH